MSERPSQQMNVRRDREFEEATRLMDFGRAREALIIADTFMARCDEASHISGNLCRGMVYEDGGEGVDQDFEKAMESFSKAVAIAPCSTGFVNLARVSMKREDGYPDARRFIDMAVSYGMNPELALCIAWYYETKPDPELEKSSEFYVTAARGRRLAGYSGYARVVRTMGRHGKAAAVDVLRILRTPALILLTRGHATFKF